MAVKQLGDDAAAAGDLLMDAPEHESFEHLVELAHDKKAWNKHIRENILKVTARDRAMSEAAERAKANVHGDWLWSESRQMVSKLLKQQRYWVVRNSLRWGYLVWRYRQPPGFCG